jgi:capsular polysaccharide biosynthesis protein
VVTDYDRPESHQEIRDILAIAWKRKWLIVVPLMLVTVAAVAGSYLITPEYASSTIIQFDTTVPLINELQGLINQPGGYRRLSASGQRERLSSIRNEITSIHYTTLLDNRLNLARMQQLEEQAQEFVRRQPNMTIERARLYVLQVQLKKDISVRQVASSQFELIVNSTDPVLARDIANVLGEIFIAEKVKQELTQIRSSQDFSDIQLEKYERQLTDKINEKTDLEKELLAIQLDESITTEANRSEISREISRTTNEIEDLRDQERMILGNLAGVPGISTNQLSLEGSEESERLKRELENQIRQIGSLMTEAAWNDPQILNFTLRLNNLLLSLEEENELLVEEQYVSFDQPTRQSLLNLFNTRTNLEFLYSKKPYLQSAMDEMTAKMILIPEYETRLAQLSHEIAAMTDLRDRFKRQQESSTISQALVQDLSISKYRVVEPAKLALGPVTPNKRRIILLGVMLGLLLGGAATLLVELLDNSFRRVEDVETALGLPVLGIMPKAAFLKKIHY